jgi:hypothetical protein
MSVQRRVRTWVARFAVFLVAAATLVALPATVAPSPSADAAVGSDFTAGNIIDDAVFYNSSAMDANAVQSFLNARVSTCASGVTCLKDYRQTTDNRPADKYCNGYTGRANESAAQIIDNVARSCGISQQVLLVLLEKEQGLVSSRSPSAWNYSAATGQGCPDTAPCDSATAGFFYQVYYAGRQYEIYRLNPTLWGYQAGRWNNILYSPYADRNCGSARVFIENQATAALYIYTPYTPNAAALNNMYGTGDACSSYGNRNFWRLFTDWFGSTHVPANPDGPFGIVEGVTARPGSFEVSGWAIDPNSADPIAVHVYVGDVGTATTASIARSDVGASYPSFGARHGFSVTVPAVSEGANNVCVYGINVGAGGNSVLKCTTVTAMTGSPVGAVESVTGVEGGVDVSGWALDPDTADPIGVHVYVDSVGTALTANSTRGDVATVYPAYGASHGYGQTIPAAAGTHNVCVYGINVAFGTNVQLGCRTVTVPVAVDRGRTPVGVLEGVTAKDTTVTASGWSLDPDTTLPIKVRLEAGGVSTTVTANSSRSDVGAAYPGYGNSHGFSGQLTLKPGRAEVCAYGVNTGTGGDTKLGCKTVVVTLPDFKRAPIGVLEAVTVKGTTATVSGWALDQDVVDPVALHIYVGSRGAAYSANKSRADVGAIYPIQGADHGFAESISVPSGRSDVCVYAINNGDGGNALLGCRTIEVTDHSRVPYGNLEGMAAVPGGVSVSGWAIDPDTADPVAVHVYVDGVGIAYMADVTRRDVAAAYPGTGDRHGFGFTVPAAPGAHNVCVYPINDGVGSNAFLGCRTVTVT